eukprot:scaffold1369_cov163-Amphora_coffeaeformis.AAC.6
MKQTDSECVRANRFELDNFLGFTDAFLLSLDKFWLPLAFNLSQKCSEGRGMIDLVLGRKKTETTLFSRFAAS